MKNFNWAKRMRLLRNFGFIFLLTGCSLHYANPYYGHRDDTKSFATEGFIASVSSLGPLAGPKEKSHQDTQTQPNQGLLLECASHSGNTNTALFELNQNLEHMQPKLQTSLNNNQLDILMTRSMLFDLNQDKINPDGYQFIKSLAQKFQDYPQFLYRFTGHTDAQGEEGYNRYLALRRAINIQRLFIHHGMTHENTQALGLGESQPYATNANAKGRSLNRRVSIRICPPK